MSQSSTVDKPWGHELIWALTDRYVGKILHVKAGEALSLQYHCVKDETIMVLTGRLLFEFFAEGEAPSSRELGPGEPFHIAPGIRHRMTAVEETDVLEVSTPELDDVVRLEDRYGRTVRETSTIRGVTREQGAALSGTGAVLEEDHPGDCTCGACVCSDVRLEWVCLRRAVCDGL